TRELREGVSEFTTARTGTPDTLAAVVVGDDGNQITFQTPEAQEGDVLYGYSTPITVSLENEDANGNGRLDNGEDSNGDRALTRRLVRTQDGVTVAVASANTIDDVEFTLLQNQAAGRAWFSTVQISLRGSKRYGAGEGKLVR